MVDIKTRNICCSIQVGKNIKSCDTKGKLKKNRHISKITLYFMYLIITLHTTITCMHNMVIAQDKIT